MPAARLGGSGWRDNHGTGPERRQVGAQRAVGVRGPGHRRDQRASRRADGTGLDAKSASASAPSRDKKRSIRPSASISSPTAGCAMKTSPAPGLALRSAASAGPARSASPIAPGLTTRTISVGSAGGSPPESSNLTAPDATRLWTLINYFGIHRSPGSGPRRPRPLPGGAGEDARGPRPGRPNRYPNYFFNLHQRVATAPKPMGSPKPTHPATDAPVLSSEKTSAHWRRPAHGPPLKDRQLAPQPGRGGTGFEERLPLRAGSFRVAPTT